MENEYYRVIAEVDLDAMAHNINEIKSVMKKNSELMAVVKADGYGHGVYGICNTLVHNGVDRLAVAIIEEGKHLRKKGVDLPIMILGYTPESQSIDLVEYDLIPTIFTFSMAKSLSDAAVKLDKIAKIHIKIDTGMGRIGFLYNEESALDTIKEISELPNLMIEGIFTHFAKADEADKAFTNLQMHRFETFNKALETRGIYIPIKHAANSAAIIDLPNAHYNLVRAGIILYGLYPSEDVIREKLNLKPAMALKTHVIFVKDVEAGTHISYGGTYVTKRPSRIATIPVGYGDGYSRSLSKGKVLINGQFAPIIGRICMDQFMVDITALEDVKIGDEVVLFGEQSGEKITAEDIADLIGTINYEVVCMVGKRVPRVYLKNNKPINEISYF